MRGMHLVRMQQEQNQKESELAELPKGTTSKKRKAKIQTHEGIRTRYKMTKRTKSLRYRERAVIDRSNTNKKLISKIEISNKNKNSETGINQKGPSFNHTKQYILRNPILEDTMSERTAKKRDISRGRLHHSFTTSKPETKERS